jgi:hypothetical protein
MFYENYRWFLLCISVFLYTEILINLLKQCVTMFCITWCNRKQFWIVPTKYIYAFLMILK